MCFTLAHRWRQNLWISLGLKHFDSLVILFSAFCQYNFNVFVKYWYTLYIMYIIIIHNNIIHTFIYILHFSYAVNVEFVWNLPHLTKMRLKCYGAAYVDLIFHVCYFWTMVKINTHIYMFYFTFTNLLLLSWANKWVHLQCLRVFMLCMNHIKMLWHY